jgi:hypothetical protein
MTPARSEHDSPWPKILADLGRGAVILAEPAQGTVREITDSARDLGMHPIHVPLKAVGDHSGAIYAIGTELLLEMGPPGTRVGGLDAFKDHAVTSLEELGNSVGYVLILDGIDSIGKEEPAWFDLFLEDLPDLHNRMLAWQSREDDPREHFFDPDGPCFIVILLGTTQALERARRLIVRGNDRGSEERTRIHIDHLDVPIIDV